MNQIAVLLPVRIETRFKPGRLLVRVIPDELWFTRHDVRVSDGELTVLGRYLWAAEDADDQHRAQAWHEFTDQVGGPRAVYLIRKWVTTNHDGKSIVRPPAATEIRDDPTFPRIQGFPQALTVWLARGGEEPVAVLTLTVDRGRILADFPDPDVPDDHRWWEDWSEAVSAGLAGEIALDGDPEDIHALYVTGLGDGEPAELFRSHAEEGKLGLLAPGTATNTVDGAPAASLDTDPALWWEILQSATGETDRAVSLALTGDPETLGHLPGGGNPHQRWNSAMVSGLWPALWGFAARDLWALPREADDMPFWARQALFPEGPFPALRVGQQPYGLLPTSVLSRWVPDREDPPAEVGLLDRLRVLREIYRTAAERRGTADGATTEHLLDLIGQVPVSPVLRHRRAWPLDQWWFLLLLSGFGLSWKEFDRAWRKHYAITARMGLHPARRYGTVSASQRLALPPVVPETLPPSQTVGGALRLLVSFAREAPSVYARTETIDVKVLQFPADSLLLRLAIRSLQVAIGDRGRALLGEEPPSPEPLARDTQKPGRLETWIKNVKSSALQDGTPEAQRFRLVVDGLETLAELIDTDPDRAGRLLTATVDTAALRIDPWLIGLPGRRLQQLREAGAPAGLGAYGWLDRPRPGSPGPTAGGLVHAPSPEQALTATILRDRAVNDTSDHRWDLDFTSRSVREADAVAEQVRVGAHLGEALGREVERIVAAPAAVARLRRDFPLLRPDLPLRPEHARRRVCDGLAVLHAAPATLGLDAQSLEQLERLRTALDTYSDALVAEAVNHVTHGRADVAGAVMDAAAGLSRPPHLGVLRTPREGRAVTTSVVLVLQDVAAPEEPATDLEGALLSPASLADPAAAAWLNRQLGGPTDWTFAVTAVDEKGTATGSPVSVTVADLGLSPADAVALPLADLKRLAAQVGAATLGREETQVAVIGGDAARRYEASVRLVTLIGRRPAGPDAVADSAHDDVDLRQTKTDLLSRYTRLRATAALLREQLDAQLAKTAPDGTLGTADATILTPLVLAARAWGVAPDPPLPPQEDPTVLQERRLTTTAARARDLLRTRAEAAPATEAPPAGGPSPAAALGQDDLIDALTALVSPTGQLAITSRLPQTALPALTPDPALTTDWLPTISAARETLARIDVQRLATATAATSGDALALWTNKPGDPWQKNFSDTRGMVVACTDPAVD
ncbi:hypothetical protein ACH9D2_06620, partial [Kocuria sp. M4R2S49]|uniref:hypothetical protein n=1 Tax=Kocuria rhizosphaericola TaxID=3376284 RepID=UPI00378F5B39